MSGDAYTTTKTPARTGGFCKKKEKVVDDILERLALGEDNVPGRSEVPLESPPPAQKNPRLGRRSKDPSGV